MHRDGATSEREPTVAKTAARSRPNLIDAATHSIANATRSLSGNRSRQPQLGRIYSRLAQSHDGRRNPVIVIPGVMGSRLIDADTKSVVWGSFGLRTTNPFASRNTRRVALPMKRGVPLRDLRDGVVAKNVLDNLDVRLLGFPVHVRAYAGILKTLGVGGYRDSSVNLASVDYGDGHFTCFQFPYDWRRSNVENAQRLDEFIRKKMDYVRRERARRFGVVDEPVRFDLVAHSMGGLVARYYLRYGAQPLPADGGLPRLTWEGAEHVERVILVGTPNAGSVETLKELVEGVRLAPLLPHYDAVVVGTMPAAYQVLPRPRHRLIVDADTGQPIDVYDVRVWEKYHWGLLDPRQSGTLKKLLPDVANEEERRAVAADHLKKSLDAARRFHAALDRPASLPTGTTIHLFAGDSKPTLARVTVDPRNGRLQERDKQPGDSIVTRASALFDERIATEALQTSRLISPINWTGVTFLFDDHLGLTSNPVFTDNALYLLLEGPASPRRLSCGNVACDAATPASARAPQSSDTGHASQLDGIRRLCANDSNGVKIRKLRKNRAENSR
ncbi:MAG: esterase/lipase family protein [Planctomycetaceae bacterium]